MRVRVSDAPTNELQYDRLKAYQVEETVKRLQARILERFPNSSLAHVCDELGNTATEAKATVRKLREPIRWVRIVSWLLIISVVLVVAELTYVALTSEVERELANIVELISNSISTIVYVGAAIFFLSSLESRIKRRRAMTHLHTLRSYAHIIDMHQLTKDPAALMHGAAPTASSPERTMTQQELARYLDYSNEMLALVGKIAALYAESFQDQVALTTVNEIETLTTGLSRKIWQKLMLLQ